MVTIMRNRLLAFIVIILAFLSISAVSANAASAPKPAAPVPASAFARDFTNGYVFPFSSARALTKADFAELMGRPAGKPYFELLRYARNEIYARHGHIFRDADLSAHYAACAWYRPLERETPLSAREEANVALIAALERGVNSGEIISADIPEGRSAFISVYPVKFGHQYAFFDKNTKALSEPFLLAEAIDGDWQGGGPAAFIRHSLDGDVLHGRGGKQLTPDNGARYEYDERGCLVREARDGAAMAVSLLNPETLCPIASVSYPCDEWGWITAEDLSYNEYLFISMPDGRYISNIGGKSQLIDKHGNMLQTLPYKAGTNFGMEGNRWIGTYYEFEGEFRAPVMNAEGKWGAIDENMKLAVPFDFDSPLRYHEGYVELYLGNGQHSYIDGYGNVSENSPSPDNIEGFIRLSATRSIGYPKNSNYFGSKFGLADENGDWLIEPECEYIYDLGNNRLWISKKVYNVTRCGLYDYDGNEILPVRYKSLSRSGDLYEAEDSAGRGLIDEAGRWLVRVPEYLYLMDE